MFLDDGHLGREPLVGLVLTAVFTLGITATFLHADNSRHSYCEKHQQVTHEQQTDEQQTDEPSDAEHDPSNRDEEDDRPHDHAPHGCQWLTWLKSNSSLLADLHPQLLILPLPDPRVTVPIPDRHQFDGEPVARVHVSPINSPPTR